MKNDPLTPRLMALSDHDRYLAQAQMARAEAVAGFAAAAVRAVGGAYRALRTGMTNWLAARTRERTRSWPHAQA
ncbi:hypothetical protein BURK1_02363 [Burkholderiales bacterium]|nr:hypothetical protein BURK1_02363 [Burkholderiales bacterium]